MTLYSDVDDDPPPQRRRLHHLIPENHENDNIFSQDAKAAKISERM